VTVRTLVSRQLRHASSTSADTVDLRLGDGSLSASAQRPAPFASAPARIRASRSRVAGAARMLM